LQVLDDGRLTDGQGRTVDFRNTILVLTSNLGSQFLSDASLTRAQKQEAVDTMIRQAFKPEFINRLDDIVLFTSLTEDDLGQIVSLYVDRLARRLGDRRLELAVTPAARTWLAERGYDPIYGARPLRRLMQRQIDDKLARALLGGDIVDGDTVLVEVGPDGQELVVSKSDLTPEP
jgi:ATP-dependent Clp protease ATP-binding subunit ClpB